MSCQDHMDKQANVTQSMIEWRDKAEQYENLLRRAAELLQFVHVGDDWEELRDQWLRDAGVKK